MANILEMEKGGQDLDLDNLGSGITSTTQDLNKCIMLFYDPLKKENCLASTRILLSTVLNVSTEKP